jgi:DNA-binding CsgD family transcriptional regulator
VAAPGSIGQRDRQEHGLLERDDALAWLDDCLRRAWTASGKALAVTGEAGVGKTSLLRAFATAHAGDADVHWGICDPLTTQRPLAPLADIARGGPWAYLLDTTDRNQVFEALLRELIGSRRPTVVVIEDVHWADGATLDLLCFLGRRISGTRVLLVVSLRDEEVQGGPVLRSTLAEVVPRAADRLCLGALSLQAVGVLAEGRAADPAEVHRLTGGNPFFVTEVLSAGGAAVPATVRDAVLVRVERLRDTERRALESVAVVPGRAELRLLAAVGSAETDLDECAARGILVRGEQDFSFRHELARRAVLESIPPGRRRELHRLVLAALSAEGSGLDQDPSRLAHHAAGGGDDAAILRYSLLAGSRAAELRAHRESARHYEIALGRSAGMAPADRADLAYRLSSQCYLVDRIADAIDAQTRALTIWQQLQDPLREGDAHRWLSRLYWFGGRQHDAAMHAARAVTMLARFSGTRELGLAYGNMAQLSMLAYDRERAVGWGTKAVEVAEALGDRELLSHSEIILGTAELVGGQPGEGRLRLEHSLRIALEAGLDEHAARGYTNLGSGLTQERDYPAAERYLHAGIDFCTDRDLDSWQVYMTAWLARAHFEQGRWDAAAEAASWVLSRPSVSPVSLVHALVVIGHLRARRGDPDVWAPLDRALELATQMDELQRLAPTAAARAEAALLQRDHPRVLREADAVRRLAVARGDPWSGGELAYLCHRAGAVDLDAETAAEPYRLALLGRAEEAAQAWDRIGCPYEAAESRGRCVDPALAKRGMQELLRLGARPAAKQIGDRLKDIGVSPPRGPRQATRSNPAQLTSRELQVLDLLLAGLHNREIAERLYLSSRTVDHHVTAILRKLGAHSRDEAVSRAARLGLTASQV